MEERFTVRRRKTKNYRVVYALNDRKFKNELWAFNVKTRAEQAALLLNDRVDMKMSDAIIYISPSALFAYNLDEGVSYIDGSYDECVRQINQWEAKRRRDQPILEVTMF